MILKQKMKIILKLLDESERKWRKTNKFNEKEYNVWAKIK